MSEKRSAKRRHLIYYLGVDDRQTEGLVGRVVDITAGGMRLISENAVDPGGTFRLRMVLPREFEHKQEITFGATSRWCTRDANPQWFSIGFEFKDISPADITIIEDLIREFAFKD
jgi:c-di-GMP-binding flagellar brake protein YcgR